MFLANNLVTLLVCNSLAYLAFISDHPKKFAQEIFVWQQPIAMTVRYPEKVDRLTCHLYYNLLIIVIIISSYSRNYGTITNCGFIYSTSNKTIKFDNPFIWYILFVVFRYHHRIRRKKTGRKIDALCNPSTIVDHKKSMR